MLFGPPACLIRENDDDLGELERVLLCFRVPPSHDLPPSASLGLGYGGTSEVAVVVGTRDSQWAKGSLVLGSHSGTRKIP